MSEAAGEVRSAAEGRPARGPKAPAAVWRLSRERVLDLSRAHAVLVLNVTPDSFSDGGRWSSAEAVAAAAREAEAAGVSVLDVGGESTRPGAERVAAAEQIRRVSPAIRAIREAGVGLGVTIDTTLAEVASAALDAGADAINDVSAGEESADGTLRLAAERGCGIVLMHRLRAPDADVYSHEYRSEPRYDADGTGAAGDAGGQGVDGTEVVDGTEGVDGKEAARRSVGEGGGGLPGVVVAVRHRLVAHAERAAGMGVAREAVAIDPGLGFGKSVRQNVELLRHAGAFVEMGWPVFAGASRKSFLGKLTGVAEPGRRLGSSLGAAAALHAGGVRLIRAHDGAEHVELLRVLGEVGRGGRDGVTERRRDEGGRGGVREARG